MIFQNRITELFKIKYPIIQGGMVWVSGHRLVAAVSNAGGLGLIGAGSMYPDILKEHIQKCKSATKKPFGVNVPLLYPEMEKIIRVILEEKIPIVFTSAGNPSTWTETLKKAGVKVAHVVSSLKFALKAQEAGVDAIVAEGFEAGGHNGREENTTLTLLSLLDGNIKIPIIAAGGIATGKAMLAAKIMGADGVQVGSRFMASEESSAHSDTKKLIVSTKEGETVLTMKELAPMRMIKTEFYNTLQKTRQTIVIPPEKLKELLGKGRLKKGIFEGDFQEGIVEVGQVSSLINDIKPAGKIVAKMVSEYESALKILQTV